jgi:hypothetical protein
MNIQTVAENLRKTIAGKEQHLKTLNGDLIAGDYVDRTVTKTTIEFLKINIDELKRILQDVEQCEPSLPGEGYNYEDRDE